MVSDCKPPNNKARSRGGAACSRLRLAAAVFHSAIAGICHFSLLSRARTPGSAPAGMIERAPFLYICFIILNQNTVFDRSQNNWSFLNQNNEFVRVAFAIKPDHPAHLSFIS